VAATRPRLLEVRGEWFVRGGITTRVVCKYIDPQWGSDVAD
jgi:NADPH-dependent 7-cyano-7-deazaguanine reductase QueF